MYFYSNYLKIELFLMLVLGIYGDRFGNVAFIVLYP